MDETNQTCTSDQAHPPSEETKRRVEPVVIEVVQVISDEKDDEQEKVEADADLGK